MSSKSSVEKVLIQMKQNSLKPSCYHCCVLHVVGFLFEHMNFIKLQTPTVLIWEKSSFLFVTHSQTPLLSFRYWTHYPTAELWLLGFLSNIKDCQKGCNTPWCRSEVCRSTPPWLGNNGDEVPVFVCHLFKSLSDGVQSLCRCFSELFQSS